MTFILIIADTVASIQVTDTFYPNHLNIYSGILYTHPQSNKFKKKNKPAKRPSYLTRSLGSCHLAK